jgi:hypothetical protein
VHACGSSRRQTATGWQCIEAVAQASGLDESESSGGEDEAVSGSFVSALHHAAGLIFVGYRNGVLEIRDRYKPLSSFTHMWLSLTLTRNPVPRCRCSTPCRRRAPLTPPRPPLVRAPSSLHTHTHTHTPFRSFLVTNFLSSVLDWTDTQQTSDPSSTRNRPGKRS